MYFKNNIISKILYDKDVIIFDMNGLIIDDEPIQLEATNNVLKKYSVKITENDWIKKCVGKKPKEFLKGFLNESQILNNELITIIKDKDKEYERIISDQILNLVRPGFLDFFQYAKKEYKIALATSTTEYGMSLILGCNGLKIINDFDFIITGDRVEKSKPNPEIYFQVTHFFGGKLKYLVFEDTEAGINSAKMANLSTIAIPNNYTTNQNFKNADLVINSFQKSAHIKN